MNGCRYHVYDNMRESADLEGDEKEETGVGTQLFNL